MKTDCAPKYACGGAQPLPSGFWLRQRPRYLRKLKACVRHLPSADGRPGTGPLLRAFVVLLNEWIRLCDLRREAPDWLCAALVELNQWLFPIGDPGTGKLITTDDLITGGVAAEQAKGIVAAVRPKRGPTMRRTIFLQAYDLSQRNVEGGMSDRELVWMLCDCESHRERRLGKRQTTAQKDRNCIRQLRTGMSEVKRVVKRYTGTD